MPVPKSGRRGNRSRIGADRRQGARVGALIFVVFVLLAGALGAFLLIVDRENVELGENLCPKDRNFVPPRVVVVLIDQTDRLSDLHQQALRSQFRQLLHQEFESEEAQLRRRFSRIDVVSFRAKTGGGPEIAYRLSLCNPGDINGLTKYHQNPELVRRTFEKRFLDRLDGELKDLLTFKDSPQSPILEAIKLVSLEILADARLAKAEKALVLVSDGLHNTPELSLFRASPTFDDVYKTPYGNRMVADLRQAKVQFLVLSGAAPQQQRLALERFWSPYFARSGAGDFRAAIIP